MEEKYQRLEWRALKPSKLRLENRSLACITEINLFSWCIYTMKIDKKKLRNGCEKNQLPFLLKTPKIVLFLSFNSPKHIYLLHLSSN